MKITIVQTALEWENREKNLVHISKLLGSVEETDLIVLPEMFTTGFSMRPEQVAEPAEGPTLQWLKETARKKNCVLTGSVSVQEGEKYFNRLYWVEASGNFQYYNKRHLFRMADEDQHYAPGTEKIITKIDGWKFCPLVCYDLRFPVWSRNRFKKFDGSVRDNAEKGEWDYDVLLYVANWPAIRINVWKNLLVARAIENQCYVVGVNRIGKDDNNYDYSGDSVIINPKGEIISKTLPNEERAETIELDKTFIAEFRKTFPVGLDADNFRILH